MDLDDAQGYFSLYYDSHKPLETVALSFTKDGSNSIVVVPLDKFDFTVSETDSIEITLHLRDPARQSDKQGDDPDGVYAKTSYSDCAVVLRNAALQCERFETDHQFVIGQSNTTVDLTNLINTYFDHAEVTIRPSQHRLLSD